MPNATPLLTNFTGGEVSPRIYGRRDLSRYYNSLEICENFICAPQGSAERRGGSRFVSECKHHDKLGWLIEFEFNDEQAYVVETGDFFLRFFKDRGRIEAPNTAAAIANGTFPADLSNWTVNAVTWSAGAALFAAGGWMYQAIAGTADVLHVIRFKVGGVTGRDKVKLRVGTTVHGSEIMADKEYSPGWHCEAFTPAAANFNVEFNRSAGTPTIDDVEFCKNGPVEIGAPWGEMQADGLSWTQSADVLYLQHAAFWPMRLTRRGHTSWSLEYVDFIDGPYLDENITDTELTPAATSGDAVVVNASAVTGINDNRGFLATDVGRCLHITEGADDGWGRIVEVVTTLQVKVQVRKAFKSTTARKTWQLGLWSNTTGWPISADFHEERLILGGASVKPGRFDGSATGDFETFTPGTDDDSPIAYNFGVNKIYWLASSSVLAGGTPGGAFVAKTDAAGAPITPTNIQVKFNGRAGAANVRPLKLDAIVYLQRHNRKVLAYDYNFEKDKFLPLDLTLLADHVTTSGIIHLAYQAEPFGTINALRTDGQVAACSYLPEQEVTAWYRHRLGGSGVVEAFAVIPGAVNDELWLIVKRTINGQVRRYIEVIEDFLPLDGRQDDAFYVDCGLSLVNTIDAQLTPGVGANVAGGVGVAFAADANIFSADDIGREIHFDFEGERVNSKGLPIPFKSKARARITGYVDPQNVTAEILVAFPDINPIAALGWRMTVTEISGLDHLEGLTVQALSDGAVEPDQVVTGGSITLTSPGSKVHVGLQYISKLKILPLEAGQREGTAASKPQRISKLSLLFLRSVGGLAGRDEATLEPIQFRTAADPMNQPEPLFTGFKDITFPADWVQGATAMVVQMAPLPMTINAIVPTVTTSG